MTDIYQANTFRNGMEVGNYQSVFRKKTERINWKKLAAVDIDRVIQQNDVGVLRDNIKHIAFCDLDSEMEVKGSDRTLAKMFKMAQLMIDYLLNSQEHLAAVAGEAEERCAALAEETENAKRKVQESDGYINDLKRECHRRKKLILAQQQIMDSGPDTYHRCPYCEKAFLNGSFLQAHLEKRHRDMYIRSMYQTEAKRPESPRRETKVDFHSSSEKRIEELVRQFTEQQRQTNDRSNEIDRMKEMMRQQRDEMEAIIGGLERQLHERTSHEHKPRSFVGEMVDDTDDISAQKAREEAVKKALNDRQRQKKPLKPYETKPEEPIIAKRKNKHVPLQSMHDVESFTSPRGSPIRQRSPPRQASPVRKRSPPRQSSPVRMRSPPRQASPVRPRSPVLETISFRNSFESVSKASEFSDFGQMWDNNEQYRLEAREQVVNTLAEHLEHHGIKRTATGILDEVLKEKLNVTDMEQRQLSVKHIDFGEIRKRLVAEVEAEAAEKIRQKNHPTKPNIVYKRDKEPQRPAPIMSAPSPMMRSKLNETAKREAEQSSESEWDDKSTSYNGDQQRHNLRFEKEALKRNKLEYEEEINDILGSPKRPSGQTNNARASSELSNSMNSSLWGPSESKAVTSVPHPGNGQRSGPTNKSSDIGNQSDSFDNS